MPVPLHPAKYESTPFFDPSDYIEYLRGLGQLGERPAPEAVVLSYQGSLFAHVARTRKVTPAEGYFGTWLRYLDETDGRVAIAGRFGFGAPAAAIMLEELIAFGSRRFISMGTAGSLRADLPPGSLVVCDSALRDEGTSYHYLPGGAPVLPSEDLTRSLSAALGRRGLSYRTGPSWTTDAVYRETPNSVTNLSDLNQKKR